MFTADKKVGRLIELRARGAIGDAEVAAFRSHMVHVLGSLRPDDKVIAMADFRGVRVVAPPLAEAIVTMLRASGQRLERGAVLVSDEAVARIQVARVLAQAHHDGRKACFTVEEAIAWLEPLLTPAERARLVRFLAEV